MASGAAKLAVALLLAAQAAGPATRIVSLVPALTEILFAIGAGRQVVGVSSFDDEPPEVAKLPRVGALLDPDTERILSLRPDLVLMYASQLELEKQLAAGNIRTFAYKHGGLADVFPTFRALGRLTGREAEAERAVAQIESRLSAVRGRVSGRRAPATLLVFGREPKSLRQVNASGGLGFLHDVLELAGGRNVFGDVKRQMVQASTEMLLSRAPEVILELHYARELDAAEIAAEQRTWDRLAAIPAVKAKRVHLLVGDHLVVPGPRIAAAAEELARAIHPEAFR